MRKQPFGEMIRDIRERRGVSMRALASSADMDPAYLSRIENGKSGAPKPETVERLADALCAEQQLESSECERLHRRLLVAAGHLQNREQLIDDLAERFATRLRDEGFSESQIDEALSSVSLPTMRAVLLGEQKFDPAYAPMSGTMHASLRSTTDWSAAESGAAELSADDQLDAPAFLQRETGDTARSYLDRHAEEFATRRRRQRAKASRRPQHVLRAGRHAELHVRQPLNKEQETQLRLMTKLIESILEEK